ncbi:hypothetical protein GIB67_016405 [Kingdonia uniflora]|uniref:DNA-directed DNA polymerase n=1 Tax=Kingdonia uniflora TaxID=39325 RepID=A0A7J7MGX3_9MAGN|nr:hypothetical protein GIB67_016405 [Kingdonia uniflora]
MDFKNPYLLCSYYELIVLAIIQLLLKYAYNQEFKYAKFTIGYVMKVPSGSGEVSYTIGLAISLNDYSRKAHPNITIYEQIQNFLEVKAENYEGLFLSGVYIRVHSINMVVKELDLTSDVIDSQIWDLLKTGVAGGIPQEVQTIAGGRRCSYINYITTIKLSIKERKSFIVDDIKIILINSIHKPYATSFVVVEQGIANDSLQDSKFKTFFRENCNHFMPTFEDRSNRTIFGFVESLENVDNITGSLTELAKNLCPNLGVKGSIQHDKLRVSMLQNQRDQLLDYMRQDIRLLAGVVIVMKAQEIYWTEYSIDITSCLTLSSLAMKIFRSRYYNDKEFPIHIPNRNEDEFFRSGYYGGHADMYKPYGKNLYYYDVNSLYPFVMKTYPMPCGTPVWNGNMRGIDLSEIFGFVQAYIITPKNIDKLFLPIRDMNGYVKDFYWKPLKNSAFQIAAAITSYARIYMYQFTSRDNCYFTDIDSAILGKPLLEELVSSTVLGLLKLECFVKEGIFLALKCYKLVIDDDKKVIKHKGPAKNYVNTDWFQSQYENPSTTQNISIESNFRIDWHTLNIAKKVTQLSLRLQMGNKRDPVYDENNLWIDAVPKEVPDLAGEDSSVLKIDLPMVEDELDNKNKELVIKFLNTILRRMAHYNLFDKLQSPGDDSNTVDTGNNSSSNASSKKKRGLTGGNNPGDVKASPALEFVPREDWVKFADYCNSEKFLAKSKRNKENRAKLISPCTLGRTSMPITRHKLAEERGATDEEIGRVELYIPAHTKKDKTIQCPDVIAIIFISTHKFGKERKGGTRGMGAGMSISLVEKIGRIVNENEELRSNNNELKFATEKLRKDLDTLTKYVGNIPVRDVVGRRLFEGKVVRDVVSWNMLVSGYSMGMLMRRDGCLIKWRKRIWLLGLRW